jgi:hypothetical protein
MGTALFLLGSLPGCSGQEEYGPLGFEPGQYLGKKDQEISEETRKQLQERARLQR